VTAAGQCALKFHVPLPWLEPPSRSGYPACHVRAVADEGNLFVRNSIPILAASLAFASTSAIAQDAAADQIVLRVEQGQVMTSQGGEFVPAQTGTVLQPGDRIMVTEGSGASVFYDDACVGDYSQPGVHVIARRCDAAAGTASSGGVSTGATVGLVAAGVAVVAVAAGGGGGSDDPSPPISR
jgi:hypothetical protein